MTTNPSYCLRLTEAQTLDVIASVETMRDVCRDLPTRARLTALLDNIAAQVGATREEDR